MKKSVFFDHIKTVTQQENTSLEKAISYVSSLGYVGADVHWTGREDVVDICKQLKVSKMKIACVYRFLDLTSVIDEVDMHNFFECLIECECRNTMIIPGNYVDDREAEFKAVCNNLNELCRIAEKYSVTVSVEDFDFESAIIGNTASLKRAFNEVPKLFHTFDTGNYAYFGESELEAYEEFKQKITHVHLKDRSLVPLADGEKEMIFPEGKTVYPSPIGKGFIKISDCLKRLYRSGYDGYISVEHFGAVNMKQYMKLSSDYIDSVLSKLV